ncbi:GSCFA domain-containing protein [Bizionia sp. KMM 8389]
MILQTKIPLKPQTENQIDYNSQVLLLGSCFVENIGAKLEYFKFRNIQNPFGVLFHPKAIENLVCKAVNKKEYTEADIFFYNEQWHCFEAHSQLSNGSKELLLDALNKQIVKTREQLKTASHIVFTFGTAWGYKLKETNQWVANCHKISQKAFAKTLASVSDVSNSLQSITELVRQLNDTAEIIFTVSPIRHLKDGFIENTQSKAHLISAIHQHLESVDCASYFPSYELMMDELRDYRFYEADMIHPNQTAINYIWQAFKDVWVSGTASSTMETVDSIQKGRLHRPFNPNSDAHKKFIDNLDLKQALLQKEYPHMCF